MDQRICRKRHINRPESQTKNTKEYTKRYIKQKIKKQKNQEWIKKKENWIYEKGKKNK